MGRRAFTLAITAVALVALPASAQALAPVGSEVVGLWQGEGNATDPFNGHDGTLLGGMGFAPNSSGQAFSFTEPEQAVDIPDSPDLYPSGSFTIAGWERTSDAVAPQLLMGHYECGKFCPTGLANSAFGLFVDQGKAEGWIRDADAGGPSEEGGQYLTGIANVADGANHYLAFERDIAAGEMRLYVDGTLDASAALKPVATGPLENLDGEADDLYLGAFKRCDSGGAGCDGALVNQMVGLVDDAVYWNRLVAPAELAAIHAAGPNGLTTDSTAPASNASAPAASAPGTIPVGFTASDPQGPAPRVHDPSGIARVELYAMAPGESGFSKVASAAASAGSFPYTASAPGTYSFATVATDAAGNVDAMPTAPDATTVVGAAPPSPPVPKPAGRKPASAAPKVADFTTAIFVPPYLYLRLKCPARFKPGCVGTAAAVTAKGEKGRPMSAAVSAKQRPNRWKVAKLTVKPQFTARVEQLSRRPDEKLLVVRQSIHSAGFEHGRPQTVFHVYRVRSSTAP